MLPERRGRNHFQEIQRLLKIEIGEQREGELPQVLEEQGIESDQVEVGHLVYISDGD